MQIDLLQILLSVDYTFSIRIKHSNTKANQMSNVAKFEVGKTYSTRSIGDSNCIIKVTVASRTKCFIKTTDGERFKVSTRFDSTAERIKPWGNFSMAPSISATDTQELKPSWEM